MIQFKRGSTRSWRALRKPLAAGQPGYDKDKHKIKIGDGESGWSTLPYASGLSAKEILNSEREAKARYSSDSEDVTVITYGTEHPDRNTVGQLYLQYYDAEPEADYVVSFGTNGIWTYQKWRSGIAKCWGTLPVSATVQSAFEGVSLFKDNNTMSKVSYPFTFKSIPSETASVQSPGGLVWLANRGKNTKSQSAAYNILSADKQTNSATYNISLSVEGFWR
jgi:hypothetical protein